MLENLLGNFLVALMSLGVLWFIYITVKIYLVRRKYRHIPGPKTKGILGFYFGNLLETKDYIRKGKLHGDLLVEYLNKYGPVFKYQVLNNILVAVADPRALKEIMIDHDLHKELNSYKNLAFPFNKRLIGFSLESLIDKEAWKYRRNLFNPHFSYSNLMNSISAFNYKADILMERLRKHANGQDVITLFDEFNSLTLDVMSDVSFNTDFNCINNPDSMFLKYIVKALEYASLTFYAPFLKWNPLSRKIVHEYERSIDDMRESTRDIIKKRFNDYINNEYVPDDFLKILIKEDSIDMDQKIDEFITFLTAGSESTASAITFTLFELAQNPQVLKKLTAEIEQVVGNKPFIDSNDLAKLEYTTCVFNEAIRKWPSFPYIARENYQDLTVNGVFLPKNTWIQVSSFMSGRNPEYFPEPEKFIPERFLSSSEISKQNKINNFTYFPFSVGPRNCIGQNFARIQAKIILAKFIHNFNFNLDKQQSLNVKANLSIRLKEGCKVTLTLKD